MWCVPCTKVLAREQWRRVLSQAARNWDRSIHVHLREVPRRLLGTWSPDLASLNLRGEHPSYQVITEVRTQTPRPGPATEDVAPTEKMSSTLRTKLGAHGSLPTALSPSHPGDGANPPLC